MTAIGSRDCGVVQEDETGDEGHERADPKSTDIPQIPRRLFKGGKAPAGGRLKLCYSKRKCDFNLNLGADEAWTPSYHFKVGLFYEDVSLYFSTHLGELQLAGYRRA